MKTILRQQLRIQLISKELAVVRQGPLPTPLVPLITEPDGWGAWGAKHICIASGIAGAVAAACPLACLPWHWHVDAPQCAEPSLVETLKLAANHAGA